MKRRRYILFGMLGLYVVGLGWGYLRLPWAAIKSLGHYKTVIRQASAVSLRPGGISVSRAQRSYLVRALPISAAATVPAISVEVRWSALVCARVHSADYVGDEGAEGRDSLYVYVFGAWIPVHTYIHVMAYAPSWRGYQFSRANRFPLARSAVAHCYR